jgi:hypothetical protein
MMSIRWTRLARLPKIVFFLLSLLSPLALHADSISGKVADPSGALIPGVRIEITGATLPGPLVLTSDASGKFSSPDLKPGTYTLRLSRDGFEPLVETVDLTGGVNLQLSLAIARQRVDVNVLSKNPSTGNSDPVYRNLRGVGLGATYHFDKVTLPLDAATFEFDEGTLTFLNPVNGVVTGAVFIGQGNFKLKAMTLLSREELKRRTGSAEFEEGFTEIFSFHRERE